MATTTRVRAVSVHLRAWRVWSRRILPTVPREERDKHPLHGCNFDTCQWFQLSHESNTYAVCRATGAVHLCKGELCPLRVTRKGVITCKATGLVVGQTYDTHDSLFLGLTGYDSRQEALGTHMGDLVGSSNASIQQAHQQQIINSRSKKVAGAEANDKVGAKITQVRNMRNLHRATSDSALLDVSSSKSSLTLSNTLAATTVQYAPETVASYTAIAFKKLRVILTEGHNRYARGWTLNMPTYTALRHAIQDQLNQQKSHRHVDLLRLVATAVCAIRDCNKRPPLHVAVINGVPVPPVAPLAVLRLARVCANTYPAASAYVMNTDGSQRRPQNYIFQAHCIAVLCQSVHGIQLNGRQLLRAVPELALWLPPTPDLVLTIGDDGHFKQRDITKCISKFTNWLSSVSYIDYTFWENEKCLAWPP